MALRSETIILVDDEDDIRKLVAQTLRMKGFSVADFPDGDRALRACLDLEPDLPIADVMMPGMDGFELAGRMQQMRGSVRVLLMSGYSETSLMPKSRQGVDAEFLQKPFTLSALLAQVQRLLASKEEPVPK